MRQGLHSEVRLIIFMALILSVVGLLTNSLGIALLLGLAAYGIWTSRRILNLYRWLDRARDDYPPESFGIWADLADHLFRLQQRNKQAKVIHRSLLRRLNSITGSLDEGLVLLNRDKSIDWWNPAAAALLQFNPDDRGRTVSSLIRDPRFVKFIQQGDFNSTLEIPSGHHSGQILMFSAAMFDAGSIILIIRDITRLRNLEQMRKDFVANISHELRTPLTVLCGYLESLLLNCEELPKSIQKPLHQMSHQTDRLTALANDLIMLSELESMNRQLPQTAVRVKPLLEQILNDTKALSESKYSLTMNCAEDIVLYGDAHELYSALSNLALNAVKHNPEGTQINLLAEQTPQQIRISVKDNGVGIDPKHLPRLTERFYRVDSGRAASTGSTGLGLAIVKHVLLRHGAELKIASQPGKGTTITCLFDRRAMTAKASEQSID